MINIIRDPNGPTSLGSQSIQDYITALSDHLHDPNSAVKPEKPPGYRNSDLLDAFDRDFHSKCYLTEEKFFNSYTMDAEHFVSKSENPLLRYEWTNLYPASHQANMIKPRTTPIGGLLDPCNPTDNVEQQIEYTLETNGLNPKFEAKDPLDVKTVNTCALLDRIHCGHDQNTITSTRNLQHAIQTRYLEILHILADLAYLPDGTKKAHLKRQLKQLLSRKSSFTMLMRSIPAVANLPADILD